MKLKFIAALVFISITSKASAGALVDFYTGASGGIGRETIFLSGHTGNKTAQSYGALIGIDIPLFRFEGEYNYLNSNNNNLHLAMLNGYFKIPIPVITPYIGVGAGTTLDGSIDGYDVKNVIAYQGMAGITFGIPLLPLKADVEARALYAPNIYTYSFLTKDIEPDFLHYDLRLKVRYNF